MALVYPEGVGVPSTGEGTEDFPSEMSEKLDEARDENCQLLQTIQSR